MSDLPSTYYTLPQIFVKLRRTVTKIKNKTKQNDYLQIVYEKVLIMYYHLKLMMSVIYYLCSCKNVIVQKSY